MADNLYLKLVKKLLPSPFTIAVILTAVTFVVALIFTDSTNDQLHFIELLGFWQKGFWELLAFSMQMVLILVLGHTLALSSLADKAISSLVKYCDSTAKAALIISFVSIAVSLINWGLCVILAAVFVRKVGDYATKNNLKINYPLLGAAGYAGMMTWHGGFSGSAPLKVAEANHFLVDSIGQIPVSATLLSPMNVTAWLLLLTLVPALFYFLGKKDEESFVPQLAEVSSPSLDALTQNIEGAERLDHSKWLAWILGGLIAGFSLYQVINTTHQGLSFINLNYINFSLFGICLLAHSSINSFVGAAQEAVVGATGIIIQFPLYAGIMGVIKYSGLAVLFSEFFVQISTPTTFPLFTLISAGIVNTFVPSGGGQWAVQGPIVTQAAKAIGVPMYKAVMALSYGDQLTNMLQPFWALPLLGITKLKAKDILPYSLIVLVAGLLIFGTVLILF